MYILNSAFQHVVAYLRYARDRISPRLAIAFGVACLVIVMLYGFFIAAPIDFPAGQVVSIKKGSSLTEIAEGLYQADVVRSPLAFLALMRGSGESDALQAGAYVFPERASIFTVVHLLLSRDTRVDPARVTFPEGSTAREMALLLEDAIPGFDGEAFQDLATPHEGFLFPDTYLIAPDSTPEDVVTLMRETFDTRVAELDPEIKRFGKSLEEIVIMASLLEKEARTVEVRRTIAGILWKRIEVGMPLQVDAVFGYIQGRATFHPNYSDLAVESPYNTYMHKGLPPGAIANPGIEAIRAAATPIQTKYLFYLNDANGRMHYAADFDGHIENRRRYQ
jgi:UPF0755 protein